MVVGAQMMQYQSVLQNQDAIPLLRSCAAGRTLLHPNEHVKIACLAGQFYRMASTCDELR